MNFYRIFIAFILLFSGELTAQEIKSNTVDPFTNERTIETTVVPVKQGLSSGFGVSYMSIDNSYYLSIIGYKSSFFSIDEKDKIWFVLEDGNVIQFNERAIGESNEEEKNNIFIYHYFAKMNDIEILKNKRVAIVRIASANGTIKDVPLTKKLSTKLQKLNEIFFNETNKIVADK